MSKGDGRGRVEPIDGERTVMGRHPNCEIVLDEIAVSRQHAQIVRQDESCFIEDLRSRNKTFLNGEEVKGQAPLRDGDLIKICGIVFEYSNEHPNRKPAFPDQEIAPTQPVMDIQSDSLDLSDLSDMSDGGKSSIITTLDVASGSSWRLSVKPEAKLRAILEISQALASVLDQEEVLSKLLEGLFRIFPQADEGFVLLKDVDSDRMRVVATKVSRVRDEGSVRVSMTVVKRAMESGKAILSDDAQEDSRFSSSDSLTDLRIRSMMCVPLIGKSGTRLGVIQIDTNERRSKFSQDDLDVLVSVASQASLTIENARLHTALLRQNEMKRELAFAKQVQSGFLPDHCPDLDGFEFADFYESAMSVGGDFFDYVTLADGRVAVLVGDVAGKGIAAALLMARLYSAARYHVLTNSSVSKALEGLNSEMSTSGLGHRFVTFLIAVFDASTNEVRTANAGHLPILIHRQNGKVDCTDKSTSGMPLGILADQTFQEVTMTLEPGDACIAYTDGITEAMNADKDLYGSDRLEEFIGRPISSAREMVDSLVSDVNRFSKGREQADDMCVVGIYRR